LHGQEHACLFARINDVKEKRPDGGPPNDGEKALFFKIANAQVGK
jgi:hypothetical protein